MKKTIILSAIICMIFLVNGAYAIDIGSNTVQDYHDGETVTTHFNVTFSNPTNETHVLRVHVSNSLALITKVNNNMAFMNNRASLMPNETVVFNIDLTPLNDITWYNGTVIIEDETNKKNLYELHIVMNPSERVDYSDRVNHVLILVAKGDLGNLITKIISWGIYPSNIIIWLFILGGLYYYKKINHLAKIKQIIIWIILFSLIAIFIPPLLTI